MKKGNKLMCCCCKKSPCGNGNNVRDSTTETSVNIELSQQVSNTPSTDTDILEVGFSKVPKALYLAIGILNGKYGNGTERKKALGTDYEEAQKAVNAIAYLFK